MAGPISDRLRAALEQLDEAIDLLEARIAAKLARPLEGAISDAGGHADDPAGNAAIVARLDRIIERIELALAD